MHEHQSGFTVIELMLALAVMAVLASLAVPSMGTFVREQRVTSTANHLLTNLNFARTAAVTRREWVVACPGTPDSGCHGNNRWDQGWIVFVDHARDGQLESSSDILRVVPADARMIMHSAGRTRVRFQHHGGAYHSNLSIRVCDHERQASPRMVIVSNPGRVRVSRDVDISECQV